MAWTSPRLWSSGEFLTAVLLNEQLRANLLALQPAIGEYGFFARAASTVETVISLNYLECNGAAVSRSNYDDLYNLFNGMRVSLGSGATTLGAACAYADTSLTISSYPATWPGGSGPPYSMRPYEILIDSERMLVTAFNGNTLTVTRAREGTLQVAHNSGATVALAPDLPFGSGDGSTTFNVPDLRGRIPYALGGPGGHARMAVLGYDENVSLANRSPAHYHLYYPPQQVGGYSGSGYGYRRYGLEGTSGGGAQDNPSHLVAGVWGIRFVGV